MTYYLRYFFNESLNTVKIPPETDAFELIKTGFYLDAGGELCGNLDWLYYIPPNAIRLLTKYEEI